MHLLGQFTSCLLITTAVFLVGPIELTEGCSCGPTHPQRQFCDATYSIKGKVISKNTSATDDDSSYNYFDYDGHIHYMVRVERVFKGDGISEGMYVEIETALSGAACGVELDKNGRYVLSGSGSVAGGSLSIYLCDYYATWSSVSDIHKQGLYYHWDKYCGDCQVVLHYDYEQADPSDSCDLPSAGYDYGDQGCEAEFARCRRDSNDNCVWYGEDGYEECVEARGSDYDYGYY